MTPLYTPSMIYLSTVGMGIIAGMRSMTAPALVSNHLAQCQPQTNGTRATALETPTLVLLLQLLAAGEMVADKIPGMPARTALPSLLGRSMSGALSGAALCAAYKQPVMAGAAIGAVSAAIAAYGSFHLRRWIGQALHVPDPLVGAIEDAVIIGMGVSLLRLVLGDPQSGEEWKSVPGIKGTG